MSKILGLDLGANSIGWALIDDEKEYIIDSGVRVFEAGAESYGTTKEQSKNTTRRDARALRRQYFRRRKRRNQLLKALNTSGFLNNVDWTLFSSINPYEVRVKSLDEKVSLLELARAFYHICQRRGYKSNRKATSNQKEDSTIFEGDKDGKKGINELKSVLSNSNFRTIGEYFASLDSHEIRIRNRYTERSMYLDEFNKIWNFQQQFYPEILNENNLNLIRDKIIFFQRKMKSQKKKVGFCKFEPKKRRAHKSHPIFQEFRMLLNVNNLRISIGDRYDTQLTDLERNNLIKHLNEKGSIKLKDENNELKKIFGFKKSEKLKVNLTSSILSGADTLVALRKAIGKEFDSLDKDFIDKIYHTLLFAEDYDWLINYAVNKWNFSLETAQKIAKISLEDAYSNISIKALTKKNDKGLCVMDYIRQGERYDIALANVGYEHNLYSEEIEKTEKLPAPKSVANPVVMVCLYQVQKVVNEIIDRYGKIDIARIEMARDLKLSKDDRLNMLSKNRKTEAEHNRIAEELKKNGINVNRNSIIRYKLWEECNKTCVYSGRPISLIQLFNGEVDIEHIIPYSRSLDDSFKNKTLCFKDFNHEKSNLTPFEFYSQREDFEEVQQRTQLLPYMKARHFWRKELDDDFISTQLNDTRYISRIALSYLKHVCDHVQVSKGQATAILRHYLGLNNLLSEGEVKSRDDHRHHAIDAAVIAITDPGKLNYLSKYHQRNMYIKENDLHEKFDGAWIDFRRQMEINLERMIVSHKCNKRVRGQLHAETLYGMLRNHLGEPLRDDKGQILFAIRKPIKSLTPNELISVIDPIIKDILIDRVEAKGGKADGKTSIPSNAFAEPVFLRTDKIRRQIKSVRIAKPFNNLESIRNGKTFVSPAGNHHISIYKGIDNGKTYHEVVSLFEAVARLREKKPVINKNLASDKEFLISLQINEMVHSGDFPKGFNPDDKSTYTLVFDNIYRVQKISINPTIGFRKHNIAKLQVIDNNGVISEPGRLFRAPSSINELKIFVSPAGFVGYDYE